ncbi:DUF421 domain-containing protein [Kocuria tytonis]|uniref:DUF421 domain-containing protein n=1 Tax=Kocuria tytonis TaxID=2054280 RepID=UPI0013145335|nr:YetF domain-containing protein [Kocuria tytonis]
MNGWDELAGELGISFPHAAAVVLSAVGIYLTFLVFVRLLGQRILTAMSTFDVVVTVMLGAVAGRVILGHPPTLASGVLGLAVLFLLEAVFGRLGARPRWQRLFNAPARILMVGADVDEQALQRAHITRSELHGALRRAGVRSYGEVACVLHEPGGGISVLRRGVPIDRHLLADVAGAQRIPEQYLAPGPEAARGRTSRGSVGTDTPAGRDAADASVDPAPDAAPGGGSHIPLDGPARAE